MECPICNEYDEKAFYPSAVKNYREREAKGLRNWRPYCRSCRAEYVREYLKRPGVKERTKEYLSEYSKRPEVKEKKNRAARKKYAKKKKKMTAAQRKKWNEYQRKYNQRPEVKAKNRERYLRKKEEQGDATG